PLPLLCPPLLRPLSSSLFPYTTLFRSFLIGFVALSIENSLARLDALALGGHVRGTSLEHLNEVPSERSLDGLAYVHRLELRKSRSEEHTSELQSRVDLVCRLLLEKKKA